MPASHPCMPCLILPCLRLIPYLRLILICVSFDLVYVSSIHACVSSIHVCVSSFHVCVLIVSASHPSLCLINLACASSIRVRVSPRTPELEVHAPPPLSSPPATPLATALASSTSTQSQPSDLSASNWPPAPLSIALTLRCRTKRRRQTGIH
eukprot:1138857-Pelagomonas_calceolata.AAC.1